MIDNTDQVLLPPSIIGFSFSLKLQEQFKFPGLFPPDITKKLSDPSSQWTPIDSLVRDDGEHLVVLEDVSLQTAIICSAHLPLHARHPGISDQHGSGYPHEYHQRVWLGLGLGPLIQT